MYPHSLVITLVNRAMLHGRIARYFRLLALDPLITAPVLPYQFITLNVGVCNDVPFRVSFVFLVCSGFSDSLKT